MLYHCVPKKRCKIITFEKHNDTSNLTAYCRLLVSKRVLHDDFASSKYDKKLHLKIHSLYYYIFETFF